jgi:hypothetical protein
MSKRKIFKLTIYGNLATGNEERQIEARSLAEAVKLKDTLLKGRPYYELTEVLEVVR